MFDPGLLTVIDLPSFRACGELGPARTARRYLLLGLKNKIPAQQAILSHLWRSRSKSGRKFQTNRGNIGTHGSLRRRVEPRGHNTRMALS